MDGKEPGGRDVLLVVSEPTVDRRLRAAFRRSCVGTRIETAESVEAALAVAHGRGRLGHPPPETVLLDLECSSVDAFSLLEELKADPETSVMPVLVVADSAGPEAIRRAYRLRANAVLRRPTTPTECDEFVRAFERFWLSRVRLPTTG